jgi:peptidoglycan/LPS O-acetylase OafA/YrhL
VAILLVVTAHLPVQRVWGHAHGANGVTVFFVLSGYLITMLALREESRRGFLDLRSFFLRRLCRIYPLYTVVLALYVTLILGVGVESARRAHFLRELPYFSLGFPEHANFFDPNVPFQVSWSLGIEEKYYLIWPFLAFVALAGLVRARLSACLLLAGLLLGAQYLDGGARVVFPYVHILAGCALALLLHRRETFGVLRLLGRPWALRASLLAVAALDTRTGYSTSPLLTTAFTLVVAAALCGIVVAPGSIPSRLLSTRPAVFVGTLSYGLYLVHQLGLNAVEGHTKAYGFAGSVVELCAGLALGLVLAYALHVTIEKPFIRLGHALSRSRLERYSQAVAVEA